MSCFEMRTIFYKEESRSNSLKKTYSKKVETASFWIFHHVRPRKQSAHGQEYSSPRLSSCCSHTAAAASCRLYLQEQNYKQAYVLKQLQRIFGTMCCNLQIWVDSFISSILYKQDMEVTKKWEVQKLSSTI